VIVREFGDRTELITQPDHAKLARRIMEHCAALAARPRRESILLAIGEHDNGWTEEDAAPTVGGGRVIDFMNAPADVRQRVWPRAVARLAGDAWAAALVANHAVVVYGRFRDDPAWIVFFRELETLRDEHLAVSGLTRVELDEDYAFLRLGDLISLLFCTGVTDPHQYREWTVRLDGARVRVSPDLFDGAVVPVEIDALRLPPGPFASGAALRDALGSGVKTRLRGEVCS
jgi:hypothetical protein